MHRFFLQLQNLLAWTRSPRSLPGWRWLAMLSTVTVTFMVVQNLCGFPLTYKINVGPDKRIEVAREYTGAYRWHLPHSWRKSLASWRMVLLENGKPMSRTDRISDVLFCPTQTAVDNLMREGFEHFDNKIVLSGDVMEDAALFYAERASEKSEILKQWGMQNRPYYLCTLHRQENTDTPERLSAIVGSLNTLHRVVPVLLPLQPRTRKRAAELGLQPLLDQLSVCEPLGYREFISLASDAALIISDSGGVQEEATIVKRPVLVVRNSTERPEILGTFAHLVAPGPAIGQLASQLLARGATLRDELEALPYPYGSNASNDVVAAIDELVAGASPF